jgi:F-actin capping protein, beta subunit
MEIRIGAFHFRKPMFEFKLIGYMLNRSPWSNEYDPPLDDGTVPSAKLRRLEIAANEAFDTYREMCVSLCILILLTDALLLSGIMKEASPRSSFGTRMMVDLLAWFFSRRVRLVSYQLGFQTNVTRPSNQPRPEPIYRRRCRGRNRIVAIDSRIRSF